MLNWKTNYSAACFVVLLAVSICGRLLFAQNSPENIGWFAQTGATRALNYTQGDGKSFVDARDLFTVEGWAEFIKHMESWLDEKGNPKSSSVFSSMGDAIVKNEANGATRVIIAGVLKQELRNAYGGTSTSTYRIVADVLVGGSPSKILRLETRTCGSATTAASCQ